MRFVGVDIAAKKDQCAAVTLDGPAIVEIEALRPPVDYHRVLAFVEEKGARADLCVMDATGVGQVVFDILAAKMGNLRGCRFTAGEAINLQGRIWSAGKAGLVQLLQGGLAGGIQLACSEAGKQQLRHEMISFRMVPGKRPGTLKYEAAEGATDDILCATALAFLGRSAVS